MISKHTFSEVLETLREHYGTGIYNTGDYSICRGNLIEAEDTIITILSECMGDEDDVIARTPVEAAPRTIFIAAISDSACKNTPPALFIRFAIYAASSVCGVIG